MSPNVHSGILVLALVAGMTGESAAQETGTPVFKAPYRAFVNHEFGGSISDPGTGTDFALEGFYRYGRGAHDFSIRGGFADGAGSIDTKLLLGGDFRTRVVSYSESFPLDGALTVGLGSSIGDGPDLFFLPVGISLGRRFNLEGSNTTFVTPSSCPRSAGATTTWTSPWASAWTSASVSGGPSSPAVVSEMWTASA